MGMRLPCFWIRVPSVLAALVFLTFATSVRANPWEPPEGYTVWESPEGHTVLHFEYRDYQADRRFPQDSFTTKTQPSTSHYDKNELRIAGHTALNRQWIFFFDLRAAQIRKIKRKATLESTGPEDQQLGFARVLDSHADRAQALALSFVIPTGSGTQDPALSTGQHAFEIDYWLWTRILSASSPLYASISMGPRIFIEGGAAQLRFIGLVGGPLWHRWSWNARLFLSRTLAQNGGYVPGDPIHNATNYNLLRPGFGISYNLTHTLHLDLLYEKEVAGEAQHAGQRFSLGLSFHV